MRGEKGGAVRGRTYKRWTLLNNEVMREERYSVVRDKGSHL